MHTQLSKDIENAALLRRGGMLEDFIYLTFFVTPTVFYRGLPIVINNKRTQQKVSKVNFLNGQWLTNGLKISADSLETDLDVLF